MCRCCCCSSSILKTVKQLLPLLLLLLFISLRTKSSENSDLLLKRCLFFAPLQKSGGGGQNTHHLLNSYAKQGVKSYSYTFRFSAYTRIKCIFQRRHRPDGCCSAAAGVERHQRFTPGSSAAQRPDTNVAPRRDPSSFRFSLFFPPL